MKYSATHRPKHAKPTAVLFAVGIGLLMLPAGCGVRRPRPAAPVAEPGAPGATQFRSYCAACHQYDGQGMGEAPPLAGSPWVTGPETRLIMIVLHGVRGRMEIEGEIYDREMPGFGEILSDQDIASLLSFVRGRFGGPGSSVTTAAVGRVRAANQGRTEYWSVGELLEEQ